MKFEGIEIALEGTGMKTTAENRRAGEGKGRKKAPIFSGCLHTSTF
jgi:hypothetical protein